MKIKILILTLLVLIFSFPIYGETLTNENIIGETAVLMDAKTGEVLYNKDMHKPMYPASTTKMMTAIIILENHNLDDVLTFDDKSAHAGGSSLWVTEGEQFTVEELLYALMVRSANDAAELLAIYHSGSIEEFATEMNLKAISIGAENTNFTNPHGLPDKNHVSTAYDLAMIGKYAMNNQMFKTLVQTARYKIPTDDSDQPRWLINKNRFLGEFEPNKKIDYKGKTIPVKYEIVDGIKTGYTDDAGNCLVSSATIENQRYISVILNSNNIYLDSRTLLDYGFENHIRHPFITKGTYLQTYQLDDSLKSTINLVAGETLIKTLQNNIDITKIKEDILITNGLRTPIEAGGQVGYIKYYYEGIEIASAILVSQYAVEGGDLITSIQQSIIKRDKNDNIDFSFYISGLIKVFISFIIFRMIITTINLRKRKKYLKARKKKTL